MVSADLDFCRFSVIGRLEQRVNMSLFGLYLVTFSSFNQTQPYSLDLVSIVELFRGSMTS